MKKLPLCLTAVICVSLLNLACTDEAAECHKLAANNQNSEAIPFCEKACNLNDGEGCFYLGLFYRYSGATQDAARLKRLMNLTDNYSGATQDVAQDVAQKLSAATYYEKACNLNYALGCLELGLLYEVGNGVRQDYQMAKTYHEKACDLNYGTGCFVLARLYERGHVLKNSQTAKGYAKEYYGKACYLGNKYGCDDYQKLDKKGY